MNHAHPSVNADEVVYNLKPSPEQPLEPPEQDVEEENIELRALGEENVQPPKKKEPGGCMGFIKKKWKKFTETNVSTSSDDLDSLERYYLYYIFNPRRAIKEF